MTKLARVGREIEVQKIEACIRAGRHLLLEGPVGAGKTHLALAVIDDLGIPLFRVDGDSRYSEQKLTGWFDPPLVVEKGFGAESFLPGPLVQAMQAGGVLFINELNRMPEGVQNVLLPAIDEGLIVVPRLGEIRATEGFVVIATQNPKEFVATSHLSEAILDRFEWAQVEYQSETEEREIVEIKLRKQLSRPSVSPVPGGEETHAMLRDAAVRLCRATRNHPRLKRGASVRAAIAVAELTVSLSQKLPDWKEGFVQAALLALPTRIELKPEGESGPTKGGGATSLSTLIEQMAREALSAANGGEGGKKSLTP